MSHAADRSAPASKLVGSSVVIFFREVHWFAFERHHHRDMAALDAAAASTLNRLKG